MEEPTEKTLRITSIGSDGETHVDVPYSSMTFDQVFKLAFEGRLNAREELKHRLGGFDIFKKEVD